MKNIVIGTGSIGKRHIKNLLSLGEDVIAYDISETNLSNVKEQFGISVYNDIDDCLKKADQGMNAFICTPAPSHIYYAQKCADLKMDLFVEKPLADSMEGLDKLVHTINANNLVSLVGCNMRFDRGLSILKQLLEKKKIGCIYSARAEFGYHLSLWRPGTDYRDNYAVKKAMGGGIILDCIHELDYICWLLDSRPMQWKFIADIIGDLETETEDICTIICKLKNGILCEIHTDYLQKPYSRTCKIIGQKGTIEWDFSTGMVRIYLESQNNWEICLEQPEYNINDMYTRELEYFLNCKKNRSKTFNSVEDAIDVLTWAISMRNQFYSSE